MSSADRKDGDKIALPLGWALHLCARDGGTLQGFVVAPDGKHSASLAYALDQCETSDLEAIDIPQAVIDALCQYEADYA